MLQKHILMAMAGILVSASAVHASVRTVDGVGGSAGVFANLSEALVDLGNSADANDGTPDVINITANTIEPNGFIINLTGAAESDSGGTVVTTYNPIADPLRINGGNNVITIQGGAGAPVAAAGTPGDHILIFYNDVADLVWQDSTVIPDMSIGATNTDDAVRMDDRGAAQITNVSIVLDNVNFVGNDGTGNPVPAENPLPAGGLGWAEGSGNGIITHFSITGTAVPASPADIQITLRNLDLAHGQRSGVLWYQDTATTNHENIRIMNLIGNEFPVAGVLTSAANNAVLNFDNILIANGVSLVPASVTRGFSLDGNTTVNVSNAVIINNTGEGILLSGNTGSVTFTDTLIANNGTNLPDDSAMISIAGAASGTFVIEGSTIHNLTSVTLTPSLVRAAATVGTATLTITDSILSGNDEVAVNNLSASASINFVNSAIVTAGPNALAGIGNPTAQTAVINSDPDFNNVLTNPFDEATAFLVQSALYQGAATGGTALTGWNKGSANVNDWMLFGQ